jgi:hypothetical protein
LFTYFFIFFIQEELVITKLKDHRLRFSNVIDDRQQFTTSEMSSLWKTISNQVTEDSLEMMVGVPEFEAAIRTNNSLLLWKIYETYSRLKSSNKSKKKILQRFRETVKAVTEVNDTNIIDTNIRINDDKYDFFADEKHFTRDAVIKRVQQKYQELCDDAQKSAQRNKKKRKNDNDDDSKKTKKKQKLDDDYSDEDEDNMLDRTDWLQQEIDLVFTNDSFVHISLSDQVHTLQSDIKKACRDKREQNKE